MANKAHMYLIWLALFSLGLMLAGCGTTTLVPSTQVAPSALGSIDNVLQNAVTGHIAYNSPSSMNLDDTVDIQLLLSPSASPEELKKKIVEAGQVKAAELQVTPLMKAELIPENAQAFSIQPFQDNPVQVVLTDQPTQWRWAITAKKSGYQVVTLTLSRQVQYQGTSYWSMVETYKNKINITVGPFQLLQNFDWKWLVGILLTALLIPAIWRYIDQRNKKKRH